MSHTVDAALEFLRTCEAYCAKFILASEVESKCHKNGFLLIPQRKWRMILTIDEGHQKLRRKDMTISWPDGSTTKCVATYDKSLEAYRISGFPKGFYYLSSDRAGDVIVLGRTSNNQYQAHIISHDEDIEDFAARSGLYLYSNQI
ncbi:MAG: hypothetical protein LUD17_01705 [Bacteroidales bacterium]|nr:hypothetical protein [Bacteroidales bacterium]